MPTKSLEWCSKCKYDSRGHYCYFGSCLTCDHHGPPPDILCRCLSINRNEECPFFKEKEETVND